MSAQIDVKKAVQIAMEFAEHIYGGEQGGSPLQAIRVETVDFSDTDKKWLITLSWNDTTFHEIPSAEMAGARSKIPRTFKVFHIDAEQGEVKKMESKEN